jgi:hypothetical protein
MLSYLPLVNATRRTEQPFPDISFREFSDFIQGNFSSKISLSSVLIMLFSITENTQLFSLHARQQKGRYKEERSTSVTAWIRALVRPLRQRIEGDVLKRQDLSHGMTDEQVTIAVAIKLDGFAKLLKLHPYDEAGKFTGRIASVSHRDINPVHVICPDAVVCETMTCKPRSLIMTTKPRDIPQVTLIKNFAIHEQVPVLAGHCDTCKTTYYADHERTPSREQGQYDKVYLNSAHYLKIGASLWVDRAFTSAVMSGVYHFHASTSAYTEFWNTAFGDLQGYSHGIVSWRQIWQAFVQESIRSIASESNINLTLKDKLSIDEVTKEAFNVLGENGLVRASDKHACKECTQNYRQPLAMAPNDDPSAVVGADEPTRVAADTALHEADEGNMNAPVKMIVMDGIVMGHSLCAFEGCNSELANARGGVYCAVHEDAYGGICHAAGCIRDKVEGTLACDQHQAKWRRHIMNQRRRALGGYRRALRRPDDSWPWMPDTNHEQTHDEEPDENHENHERDHFTPSRIYCVETICAPCGVVIAWAKFAKAESPTNILQFLEHVYPTEESRPDYICIDKACLVLRTSISNGSWERWRKTSRFIVDSYHYVNHRATDVLCRTYCNPAPLNGSAPNLVVAERSETGEVYYKRAFNTQACEQLNAWLGGFETILKRMTHGNFNWFLHTMLFYHTRHVLKRQSRSQSSSESDTDSNLE